MKDKDYRELQFSSSQLVFVFLTILVLGIFIFLLGVSVGKKQVQIRAKSEMTQKMETGITAEKAALPTEIVKSTIQEELKSYQKEKTEEPKPELKKDIKPVQEKENHYYIQVGAFADKESAASFAKNFKEEGYSALVLDPFPSDKKPVFRVRLGSFETLAEAEKTKSKLVPSSSKRKAGYFIVKS